MLTREDDTDDSQPFLRNLPVGDLAFPADEDWHALDIIAYIGEVVYSLVGATSMLIPAALDLSLFAEEDRISLNKLARSGFRSGACRGSPSVRTTTFSFASDPELQYTMRYSRTNPAFASSAPYPTILSRSTSTSLRKSTWRSSATSATSIMSLCPDGAFV